MSGEVTHFALEVGEGVTLPGGRLRLTSVQDGVGAFEFTPDPPLTLEARILAWMNTRDTGASSEAIASATIGLRGRYGTLDPSDSDDLGRCLRLIALIPEAREGVRNLAAVNARWAALDGAWEELTEMGRVAGLLDRTAHWVPAINARLNELRFPAQFLNRSNST